MSFGDQLRALLKRMKGSPQIPEAPETTPERTGGPPRGPSARPGAELDDADIATLRTVARCTACGACDVSFDGYADAARPVFRGPSQLVLSYARRLDEHGAAKHYVESLRRGSLEELSRICPVGVPFVALADLVERRARALEPDESVPVDDRARHDPG